MTNSDAVLVAVIGAVALGRAPWAAARRLALDLIARRRGRVQLRFVGEGTVIVPVRFSLERFASTMGSWTQLAQYVSVRVEQDEASGAYDLYWKTEAPAQLADVPMHGAVAAAIDLLHAVDELDDPTVAIAAAATKLREAVGELAR